MHVYLYPFYYFAFSLYLSGLAGVFLYQRRSGDLPIPATSNSFHKCFSFRILGLEDENLEESDCCDQECLGVSY